MISLHRLNHQPVVINALQILTLEATPDTIITLTNHEKILVRESIEDVIAKATMFLRSINGPIHGVLFSPADKVADADADEAEHFPFSGRGH